MTESCPLDRLAAELIAQGSRFARVAWRSTGVARPLVALRVLANLQFDGPQRIGQLTAAERITQPAMTATVNRLEADGLVRRLPDPEDARVVVVELTPAGLAELTAFRARAAAQVRPALEALSEDDRVVLARAADLLDRLAHHCVEPDPSADPNPRGVA